MKILSIGYHDPPDAGAWPGYSVPGPCWRFATGFRELGHEVVPANIKVRPLDDRYIAGCDACWLAGQQLRWWDRADAERWLPEISKRMPVMVNYCDIRDEPEPWFELAAEHATVVFHAAGGIELERLLDAGFTRAGFLPGPAFDWAPLLEADLERDIGWFFSGSQVDIGDGHRNNDLWPLGNFVGWGNLVTPGMYNVAHIAGRAHAELMWRARRGLAVSHYHDRPKYTSMRTWAYMLAGIDVVVRWFPGCDEVLPPDACVYSTVDELLDFAEQPRNDERAAAMRAHVQENYSPRKLAELALLYLEGGGAMAPRWAELVAR